MKFYVKTFEGLEEILKQEIIELGLSNVESGKRIVSCEGEKADLYRLNLGLFTGLRILVPFYTFEARDEDELYNTLKKYDWTSLLTLDSTFAIGSVTNSEVFTHSRYVTYKMKDAISDSFMEKFGKRPDVDTSFPDVKFNIHINDTSVTISLDSSGESLHKRGYRLETNEAPLNEVLASGILKLSGWNGEQGMYDPMCGSGTFLIEAACIATNRPPCLMRPHFGFMTWEDFDPDLFQQVKVELAKEVIKLDVPILGADKSLQTIRKAEKNIEKAKFTGQIVIKRADFFTTLPPENIQHVFMNPPYGERLVLENPEEFYAKIGDTFKQKYQGKEAFMISSNFDAFKALGLKASSRRTILNAGLECRLNGYEMYSGTKRVKPIEDQAK